MRLLRVALRLCFTATYLLCRYYTGAKTAPVLTLVIGGNHEASNYMWELYVLSPYLVMSLCLLSVGFTGVGSPLTYFS